MKLILGILGIIVVLAALGQFSQTQRAIPLADRYPAPWINHFHAPISQTLANHHIRDCGQYRYRASSQDSGEYRVRCSADGTQWQSYLVWPDIGLVAGPQRPAPALD